MKIVTSINLIYSDQRALNTLLKKEVDKVIGSFKLPQWHYVSRLKEMESYAQKLESGRVFEPNKLEDFFACTIVVENIGSIKLAKKEIKKYFRIHEERPKSSEFTHKESSSFIFDDLRMYATIKPTSAKSVGPINSTKFEIQIKTFLQHAWSIATHDLVYKSDSISWIKQRVAYQVKAMLENAEVSIEKANSIKRLPGIPRNNKEVTFQNEIRNFILSYWKSNLLPQDLVRLINNIQSIIKQLTIELTEIRQALDLENASGRGIYTLNLPPYLIILQSIINQKTSKIQQFLKRPHKSNSQFKLFIPKELDTTLIKKELASSNRYITI